MTSIKYKISYVILSLIGGMLLLDYMMLLLLKCWKFLTVIISQRQHRNCSWRIFWKLFRCLLVLIILFIFKLLLISQSLAAMFAVFGTQLCYTTCVQDVLIIEVGLMLLSYLAVHINILSCFMIHASWEWLFYSSFLECGHYLLPLRRLNNLIVILNVIQALKSSSPSFQIFQF